MISDEDTLAACYDPTCHVGAVPVDAQTLDAIRAICSHYGDAVSPADVVKVLAINYRNSHVSS